MPTATKTAAPVQELAELRISDIKPHPSNPRTEVGNVDELAASIAEQGVLEPLLVVPDEKPGKYLLLAGHRRHAAAKQAGIRLVPALIRHDLTDTAAQVVTMLTENLQRADLTPAEEGKAYQLLLGLDGWTQKRIVAESGRPASMVSARLKLVKLPDSTLAAQSHGQLTLETAMKIAEFADDPDTVAALEAAATGRGVWGFDYHYQNAKRAQKAARARAAAERQLQRDGVPYLGATFDVLSADDSTAERLDKLQIEPADHAKCAGHAGTVDGSGDVVLVCASAALHHPDEHTAMEQRDADWAAAHRAPGNETDAEKAERETREAALVEAAKTRRDYLYRLIVDSDADTIDGLAHEVYRAHFLQRVATSLQTVELTADLLGIDTGGIPAKNRKKELMAAITDRAITLTVAQMVVVHDIAADNSFAELRLAEDAGWGVYPAGSYSYQYGDGTLPWVDRLHDLYGYVLTPAERDARDEGERRRAAAKASKAEVDLDFADEADDPTDQDDDVDGGDQW